MFTGNILPMRMCVVSRGNATHCPTLQRPLGRPPVAQVFG